MKILGLQANLLGANPGMAKSHAYWTRTLVILAFLIGWVEGEDVPSSCLECPNGFTLADGRCFSVKQQVWKRGWQSIRLGGSNVFRKDYRNIDENTDMYC